MEHSQRPDVKSPLLTSTQINVVPVVASLCLSSFFIAFSVDCVTGAPYRSDLRLQKCYPETQQRLTSVSNEWSLWMLLSAPHTVPAHTRSLARCQHARGIKFLLQHHLAVTGS